MFAIIQVNKDGPGLDEVKREGLLGGEMGVSSLEERENLGERQREPHVISPVF